MPLQEGIDLLDKAEVLALDYETQGLFAHQESRKAAGIGLSDGEVGIYINLLPLSAADKVPLYDWLQTKKLVGHNVTFDGAWYLKECGRLAPWVMCTSAMFKYLATEGWTGQRWSLKVAMTDILGWDENNTDELHTWLKERKLPLSEMWQAPVEILGRYCALDAGATHHLYQYFMRVLDTHPSLLSYMQKEFLDLSELTLIQQFNGIKINTEKLAAYAVDLTKKLNVIRAQFLAHEEVAPHIRTFNSLIIAGWEQRLEEMPQYTKTGKITKRYESLEEKIKQTKESADFFKVTSNKDLCWLFYEQMKYPVKRTTKKGAPSVDKNVLPTFGEPGKILTKYNEIDKELQYVNACLSTAEQGVLHPMMKLPGTVTGRCSGGIEG